MSAYEKKNNVIQMPGLVNRLVDSGMAALKEKRHYDALTYFNQVVQLEKDHSQGRYGLVIANIELNRLEEAKAQCQSMLDEGIGDYFDILKVYISLLVQLGDYEEVVDILEETLPDNSLPEEIAESFTQLLSFAKDMTDDSKMMNVNVEESDMTVSTDELIERIHEGSIEQQWGALHTLSKREKDIAADTYKAFLAAEDHHPVMKSYVLTMMDEMGIEDTFLVHKFGHTYKVRLPDDKHLFHREQGRDVIALIRDHLEDENPSLLSLAEQLWWHYLFAIYPKPLPDVDARDLAAGLHMHLHTLMIGDDLKPEWFAEEYGSKKSAVISCCTEIKEIELLLHRFEEYLREQ
ncbi:tetratricopeptide repeat protein [Salisediminibacterium selenitireducens]|uniref:TPR repeat-containing protein n=1 Tax=Bacillus selenitireducens (strain ATCC 700615 / DSM 15326 / MLS10) TaxID=439292 RepID=D6XSZ0_BACIE|nr:tetratricopeptide repeat protein [Salisediminibacterium selenitireducens]ADH98926.1 hypothetical protein Bsel_1414 [[Bacillus] selenitireducens MLS10]